MSANHRILCAALVTCASSGWAAGAQAYGIKMTENGAMVHWPDDAVALRLDPSVENMYGSIAVRDAIDQSAQAWRGLPGVPDVMLKDGEPGTQGFESPETASNGVYVLPQWPLNPTSLAVTVATFDTSNGETVDSDILINPTFSQTLLLSDPAADPELQYDLQSVLTHEVGHFLGLDEAFGMQGATMYPDIQVGETHQHDLHEDDIEGVGVIYAERIADGELEDALDMAAGSMGCGGASVTGRTSQQSTGTWALVLMSLGVVVIVARRSKDGSRVRRSATVVGILGLLGAPLDPTLLAHNTVTEAEVNAVLALSSATSIERIAALQDAARSDNAEIRTAAAAVLEANGVQEETHLAAQLSLDEDPVVAAAGQSAAEALRTAPPAHRVSADTPTATRRLSVMMDGSHSVYHGKASLLGVVQRDGLYYSHYRIEDAEDSVVFEIPGGTVGRYTQVVSEQILPPSGAELTVAVRDAGPAAWAYSRDGLLYGGWLGLGPAIELP